MSLSKKPIVWVNGCFDILHDGHLDLLEYASSLGELHIGLDCDLRVRKLKGIGRPVNSQTFRKRILKSLKYVKKVYIFELDQELRQITKKLKPDFMVIGSDYIDKTIIGAENMKEIVFYEKTYHSTTYIIKKIKNG